MPCILEPYNHVNCHCNPVILKCNLCQNKFVNQINISAFTFLQFSPFHYQYIGTARQYFLYINNGYNRFARILDKQLQQFPSADQLLTLVLHLHSRFVSDADGSSADLTYFFRKGSCSESQKVNSNNLKVEGLSVTHEWAPALLSKKYTRSVFRT